jgi:beta-glucosidase
LIFLFYSDMLTNLDAGIASAEGGLDMAMPNGGDFWGVGGSNLTTFVRNGSLSEARVNDSAYFQILSVPADTLP